LLKPAFIRADWTFCRAGNIVVRKLPLKVDKSGSLPTAAYLAENV
jgi:hypothetical protein